MQASLITFMQNNVDPSVDAGTAGYGIRINSAGRAGQTNMLFTTILQNGIAVNVPCKPAIDIESEEIQLSALSEDAKNTDDDESDDVCTLLTQMMIMGSSAQTDGKSCAAAAVDEKALNGIQGIISNISASADNASTDGQEKAASVILQNDGKAADVLQAMAEKNSGEAATPSAADTDTNDIVAGIAKALSDEMKNAGAKDGAKADAKSIEGVPVQKGTVNRQQIIQPIAGKTDEDTTPVSTDQQAQTVFAAELSQTEDGTEGTANAVVLENEITPASRNERKVNVTGAENTISQGQTGDNLSGATVAEKTTAVESALTKFTDDLKTIQSGNQEIKIVLEPESLGVLTISVIKTESGISAKIKAEDKEIAAIISDQLHKLVSSMQDKGITVDDVDVTYSQTERQMDFTQQSFSQARDDSSRGYPSYSNKDNEADATNSAFWQSYSGDADDGDAAVSYRI